MNSEELFPPGSFTVPNFNLPSGNQGWVGGALNDQGWQGAGHPSPLTAKAKAKTTAIFGLKRVLNRDRKPVDRITLTTSIDTPVNSFEDKNYRIIEARHAIAQMIEKLQGMDAAYELIMKVDLQDKMDVVKHQQVGMSSSTTLSSTKSAHLGRAKQL